MNELALFAGAGGGILGGKLLGWRTICAVELDPYARRVLLARQADGCLEPFPIWDNVTTFEGNRWRGRVDVVSGGFPCQDISAAGKGAGIGGSRSGLWREMARIIGEVQPRYVFVENSPMLVGRGLGLVLLDLAKMGYDARWGVVGACDAGAPHRRDRIWIVADAANDGVGRGEQQQERREGSGDGDVAYAKCFGQPAESDRALDSAKVGVGQADQFGSVGEVRNAEEQGLEGAEPAGNQCSGGLCGEHGPRRWSTDWWLSEPNVGGMADGVAPDLDAHGADCGESVGRVAKGVRDRVNRLKCIGNGQVPAAAAMAWRILTSTP